VALLAAGSTLTGLAVALVLLLAEAFRRFDVARDARE
jgi:hypothetical protein